MEMGTLMDPKREKDKRRGHLPPKFRPFFWDYDFRRLTWQEDRDVIVMRLLSHGDWEALQWLHARLKREGLREWILARKGAGLSARQLRFWELILDLPHREVNKWVKDKRRTIWERRAT